MDLKKNDIIDLKITSMTAQGSGVGKTEDGIVIFVPNSAVGDELEVRVLKTKKTYAYGRIESVRSPSPDRIEPDCPVFFKCGGCVFRHISYEAELKIKYDRVRDALERIGGFKDIRLDAVVPNPRVNRYRNKAQLPALDGESVRLGFFANHSHRIIPLDGCFLQPELFDRVMKLTEEFMNETAQTAYDERTLKGRLRHLYIRYAEATGELMVCLVVNGNGLKQEDLLVKKLREQLPELKTVVINSNREDTNVIMGRKNRVVYGEGYITDILRGKRFKLSALSFYQVNRTQAERLYEIAENYAGLSGGEVLLDLYCGTGTIGLTMAEKCRELIGVEIVEDAVNDARENARLNGVTNARFICGDAAFAAEKLRAEGIRPDVIIIDPPRKGCDAKLIETVVKMAPKRVVYVSCDPETLARDLRLFDDLGYSPREVTPVDLFSRTAHIENVALIERCSDDH